MPSACIYIIECANERGEEPQRWEKEDREGGVYLEELALTELSARSVYVYIGSKGLGIAPGMSGRQCRRGDGREEWKTVAALGKAALRSSLAGWMDG